MLINHFHLICGFVYFTGRLYCIQAVVPCPLEWVKYQPDTFNSTSQHYIFSFGDNQVVARAKGTDGLYHAGYLQISLESAYIPQAPYLFTDIELLRNIHNCTIGWKGGNLGNQKLRVSVDRASNSTTFIGRSSARFVLIGTKSVSVGEVFGELLRFVPFSTSKPTSFSTSESFDYLISTSKGLDLHLKDFEFTSLPDAGNYRVMNVESIDNYANCIVSQVVTHSKIVTQTHSFTEFGSTTQSWGISASLTYTHGFSGGASISGSISGGYSEENEDSWSETLTTSTQSEITISKNITVGEQESILACSAIQINDNFQSDYKAKAEYTAPGLFGYEIEEILDSFGFMNITPTENSAYFYTKGTFQGSAGIKTYFHVSPKKANINCRNLKEMQT